MKPRILLTALILAAPAAQPTLAAPAERPPNILFILADDMGMECVSSYGGQSYETPNLDRLAASGVRFTNAFSNPLCTPSRVQLMTGLYNVRNYVKFGRLPDKEITFANRLRDAGYATAMAGKWQLGIEPDAPKNFGFDDYLLWQHTRPRTKAGTEIDSRYPNPEFERNGVPVNFHNGEYGPDVLVDYLGEFMKKNRERPFLAYYSMLQPHCPFSPTPDSKEWDPKSPGSSTYEGDPRFFGDMIARVDRDIGTLLAKLDELGLRENTLVIFTADNGTDKPVVSRWNGRNVPGAKRSLTDAGIRVPLIASWPGRIPEGQISGDLVDFADFFPTLCELARAPLPEKYPADGVSLVPALMGQPGRQKPWVYVWFGKEVMARTQTHMVRGPQTGTKFEFFDVSTPYKERLVAPESLTPELTTTRDTLTGVIERLAATRPVQGATASKKKENAGRDTNPEKAE